MVTKRHPRKRQRSKSETDYGAEASQKGYKEQCYSPSLMLNVIVRSSKITNLGLLYCSKRTGSCHLGKMMLSHLLYVYCFASSWVSARAAHLAGPNYCNQTVELHSTPGVYNVVPDVDPNFVYYPENCTSTAQKIIPTGWGKTDCSAAIDAVCGTTSVNSAVVGSWTWAWHTTLGTTCQAGLYQAMDAGANDGLGLLDEQCCRVKFRAMLNILEVPTSPSQKVDAVSYNRLSMNIAPGGFPFTRAQSSSGNLVNADGMQVAAGYPSFILQGYGVPRNCGPDMEYCC